MAGGECAWFVEPEGEAVDLEDEIEELGIECEMDVEDETEGEEEFISDVAEEAVLVSIVDEGDGDDGDGDAAAAAADDDDAEGDIEGDIEEAGYVGDDEELLWVALDTAELVERDDAFIEGCMDERVVASTTVELAADGAVAGLVSVEVLELGAESMDVVRSNGEDAEIVEDSSRIEGLGVVGTDGTDELDEMAI